MTNPNRESKTLIISLTILAIILIAGLIYSYIRISSLSSKVDTLATNVSSLANSLASTTDSLQNTIAKTSNTLSQALSTQQANVGSIKQQLGTFQNQVGTISGTVNNLQKLATTDPQLLKKYSKVYFLTDTYLPDKLSEIPLSYQYSDKKQLLIRSEILSRLESMINDATKAGIKLYAFSAYRSFAEQKALKGSYTVTYGAGTANSFSADQGYSEHQLGTALDFITSGLGGALDGFDDTAAYTWMQNNAYKYGFILSYPKNNGYFVFEPWHWRFVGVKLATDLHDRNKNFYELSQDALDEYLVNIFD